MEDEKITLDRDSFKALASDTRVAILKSLGRQRKMLTELSKQLGMSPSTVKEHMDNLSKAGLVVQIDDGHKWKYYELTRKGENILNPVDTRIWIILSLSIVAMLVAAGDMLRNSIQTAYSAAPQAWDMLRAPAAGGAPVLESAEKAADAALQAAAPSVPYLHIAALVIFGVLAAVCAFHIIRKR
jgi:DNA-binding transcriptional ArsR family regulator